jgi:hypothetical protein
MTKSVLVRDFAQSASSCNVGLETGQTGAANTSVDDEISSAIFKAAGGSDNSGVAGDDQWTSHVITWHYYAAEVSDQVRAHTGI